MSNIAFVLRQNMPHTQVLLSYGKELDETGLHMAKLVHDLSTSLPSKGSVRMMLELYELADLGKVAGLLLYSGDKGYEEKMDVILVPDFKALAIREDFGHKYGREYTLYDVRDLYRDGGRFQYAPPVTIDGIEAAIIAKLEEFSSIPV